MRDSGMLLDLYGCAGQPQGWPRLLDRLCAETRARSAVLQAFRFDRDAVRVVWQVTDTLTAQHSLQAKRLDGADNPRIDRHRMLRALNRVVRDDDIFDAGEPARDSLRSQLAHAGLGAFMGALHVQPDGQLLGIALHRAAEDSVDFNHSDAARLETLVPHFEQAWELGRRLHACPVDMQRVRAQMDMLRCGVLICDADGRVRWMNRSARALIDEDCGLGIQDGALRARVPAKSALLRGEIAEVARAAHGSMRYVACGAGSGMLHLALRSHLEAGDEAPAVMVAITNARSLIDVPADAWSRLLGVTPAEASLVAALAQGKTLEEHAALRGISIGTARNQLKQALAKTGSSRQADLVRLALTSAAAHVLDVVPKLTR